ncbi:MAG: cyclic nucleotide-binding domain-containing protein [Chloroflexi bacterium]|nr:cyclic nucleotide-binding domain-containing protein [Chloroflexota bacterium]
MNGEIIRLKKAFMFQGLPDEALKVLAQKITRQRLKKDEVLFRRGDSAQALFIIEEGEVKIVREDENGGELALNRCGAGETIGEMSLFDREPRSASVVAAAPTHVLELKREAFFELLNQHPDVAVSLIRSLSSRLRFASAYIQTATEWSKKIAEGDYSFMEQNQPEALTDEDKAEQMLFEFFKMAKGVKEREESLERQVQKLTLVIDEAKRRQEVEELTSAEFYSQLKTQAQKIRAQRRDRS